MNAITTQEAGKDLEALVHSIIQSIEPTIMIAQDGSKVVVMPIEEYNSLSETDYLISNPKTAYKLRQALEQVQNNQVVSKTLAELDLWILFSPMMLGRIICGGTAKTSWFGNELTALSKNAREAHSKEQENQNP